MLLSLSRLWLSRTTLALGRQRKAQKASNINATSPQNTIATSTHSSHVFISTLYRPRPSVISSTWTSYGHGHPSLGITQATSCLATPDHVDCRTLVVATIISSVLVHSTLISGYHFLFIPQLILRLPPKIPEIWRLVLSFLITRPKLSILMDPYFRMAYHPFRKSS